MALRRGMKIFVTKIFPLRRKDFEPKSLLPGSKKSWNKIFC
jgi:hypothetical protein